MSISDSRVSFKPIPTDKAISLFRDEDPRQLFRSANELTRNIFGNKVYVRGLIEFSNYCSVNCLYCGIRRDNALAQRYRLTPKAIFDLVKDGVNQGLQTFVLQGGEDPKFSQTQMVELVSSIKEHYPEVAITLSVGIRSNQEYRELGWAGADRFLMRFETSDPVLHKKYRGGISLERRIRALKDIREAGFELGSGFMTGLPGETEDTRIANALLCQELELDMVGIGPFIPHPDTPLGDAPQEPLDLCLKSMALVRLLLPNANLPATTAAGSLDPKGREKMLAVGANVLMPNITPEEVKKDYLLYPNKICLDESGFECISCLDARTHLVDKTLSFDRGNSPSFDLRRQSNG